MSAYGRHTIVLAALLAAPAILFTSCSARGRGEDLYELHCAECHQQPNPDLKKQPPDLAGLFRSKALPSGAPATDQQVRQTIIQGIGTMPAFDGRLTPREVDDLIQYLHTK